MAITAKVDAFALANATNFDVQPAVGEVWLVKEFLYPTFWTTANMTVLIGLWDGTDHALLIAMGRNDSGSLHPGTTHTNATGVVWMPATTFSLIVTNAVRMRFFYENAVASRGNAYGYSGVLL